MNQQELETLTQAVLGRLFVEVEASGRHVHLTREQAVALFGHDLTPHRPLSQPGQFLAKERLTIRTPKGEFAGVAVLGPARKEAQVELSLTDARMLGLEAPVRLSGSTQGTPGIDLIGPCGSVHLEHGVLAAKRHVHLPPEDAARFRVKDGQEVRLQIFSARPVVFEAVTVRVSPDFAPRAHLDYDEANACGLRPRDLGRILP